MDKSNILVSIICNTYNHEPYIRQCLEGFVMQKTNFPFEVLIHDDASTDNTADIIREYEVNYPDIIKPIYQTENQYSKKTGIMKTFQYPRVKGKYIAFCEGDDYWIDPLKLQKQVDFLDNHPDYSMCFHNAKIINETLLPFSYKTIDDREFLSDELFKEWIVPTASILAKKTAVFSAVSDIRIINGDINIVLACANIGKVYGMSDYMSVYRVQSNGVTISRGKNDLLNLQLSYIGHYECLQENYKKVSSKYFDIKIADTYINIALFYIRKKRYCQCISNLYMAFKKRPGRLIYRLLNKLK